MKKCREAGEKEREETKEEAEERTKGTYADRKSREERLALASDLISSLVDGHKPPLAMRKPRKPRWPLSGRDIAEQLRADGCGLECNSPVRCQTTYLLRVFYSLR